MDVRRSRAGISAGAAQVIDFRENYRLAGWDCCGRPGRRPFGPGADAPSKIAPRDFVEPPCLCHVGSNPTPNGLEKLELGGRSKG
jgi:hypothetical protein